MLEQVVCTEICDDNYMAIATEENISIARAISTITGIPFDESKDNDNLSERNIEKEHTILDNLSEFKNTTKKIEKQDNSTKNKTLETEVEDSDEIDSESDEDENIVLSPITYSFEDEEFAAGRFRTDAPLDYIKLWYGETRKKGTFASEPEYETESVLIDETAEIITENEAKKTLVQIQYATVFGSALEVSSIDRRKFDMWIKFNSALFGMFERLYAVTNDVNYAPLT